MRKSVSASIALALFVPAAAQAKPVSARHAGVYRYLRRRVVKEDGAQAAGRNVLEDGLSTGKAVTDAVVRHSITIFERDLYYRPPVVATTSTSVASASATSYSSGSYAIPSSVVNCESGGNPTAVNPTTGAGGLYQIIPSTWRANGGTGVAQDASPAEQTAVAQRVLASQGPGAWSCWR